MTCQLANLPGVLYGSFGRFVASGKPCRIARLDREGDGMSELAKDIWVGLGGFVVGVLGMTFLLNVIVPWVFG